MLCYVWGPEGQSQVQFEILEPCTTLSLINSTLWPHIGLFHLGHFPWIQSSMKSLFSWQWPSYILTTTVDLWGLAENLLNSQVTPLKSQLERFWSYQYSIKHLNGCQATLAWHRRLCKTQHSYFSKLFTPYILTLPTTKGWLPTLWTLSG